MLPNRGANSEERGEVSSLRQTIHNGRMRVPELMHSGRGAFLELTPREDLLNIAAGWSKRIDLRLPARATGHRQTHSLFVQTATWHGQPFQAKQSKNCNRRCYAH